MSNGDGGPIYWSPAASQFYQSGRRGAVSREQALPRLRQDDAGRWRDELGRFVPNRAVTPPQLQVRRFIALDDQQRPYISAQFTDKLTSREAYENIRLDGNQMLVTRTVVRTPDGKGHVMYASTKLGARVDTTALNDVANRRASGDLRNKGYDLSTNQVGNLTTSREYLIRTVTTRRTL